MILNKKAEISKKYKKLTPLQHLLLRPHMFIGEIYDVDHNNWVLERESVNTLCIDKKNNIEMTTRKPKMENIELTYNPGILKLFDEIILNACDHSVETNRVTKIKVNVSKDCISIENDGPGIPIIKHTDEKVWIPEMIFTHFLTSTNYDDDKTRLKSGLNGLGAKITSAFSKLFIVETESDGIVYRQRYKDNLNVIEPASVTPSTKKKRKIMNDFTRITFYPDFNRLNIKCITPETFRIIERRAYDIAAYVSTSSGVFPKVYFNNKAIGINSFKEYIQLFLTPEQLNETLILKNERWNIAICSSVNDQFSCISFVNGINTRCDGTHVNYILNQIIKHVMNKLNKVQKKSIRSVHIKEQLQLIMFAKIENPEFKSQAKEELTTKPSLFGSEFIIKESQAKKITSMHFMHRLKTFIKIKELQTLSLGDGKKKRKITGIPNFDDANKAGGKFSGQCTLFLTEGISAKTFAVSGLSVIGRDYYGIFPLKGKLINVRSANNRQIANNNEIKYIKQILGLQTNKKYSSYEELKSTLRYGRVCFLTDSDVDAYHIRGLLINLFHYFWPELVTNGKFLNCLQTPIVKAFGNGTTQSFYNLDEYEQWKAAGGGTGKYKIKYYKGLGSSTSQEAKEIFKTFEEDLNYYQLDEGRGEDTLNHYIRLAFSKHKIEERKKWIKDNTGRRLERPNSVNVSFKQFFNTEFIQFSIADCVRSIPNVMDGLKPSQRKILYGFLKKTSSLAERTSEIKVDQLRGYVAEQTLYAHGDMSLNETIVSMNQDFVGSNNINLFIPCGAFGSRLLGGKDAASPRYISTKINPMTRILFNEIDDNLLDYNTEDSISIEPEKYYPIIPMILVNGATGIGTGYSCDVPCYQPIEVIAYIEALLNSESPKSLFPWYKDFTGTIKKNKETKTYETQGIIEYIDDKRFIITELPIHVWTQKYKDFLDQLVQDGTIQSFLDNSTESKVKLTVICSKKQIIPFQQMNNEQLLSAFKLKSIIKFNLTLFDNDNKLVCFKNVHELIRYFFKHRLMIYEQRYEYMKQKLTNEKEQLNTKIRFIQSVIDGKIKVFKKSRQDVIKQLMDKKFVKQSHEYLLNIPIHYFTNDIIDKYNENLKQLNASLRNLKSKSPKDLWLSDLSDLKH